MVAQEEWLRCRHDASPMLGILEPTPMWVPYILFSDLHDIKTYIYHVFKSLRIIKEHRWTLTLSWPDKV